MHKSSYLRMEYLLNYYKPLWKIDNSTPINVLDIGSYNQNGTYKDIFYEENIFYKGLDMKMGPNVDIVPEDIYSWNEIENETYNLVISGQAFEHMEYPWVTMKEVERVLKPSGISIIIAPNAGIEHKAPLDCYRFFSDGLVALAKWAGLKVIHSGVAGVPYMKDTDDWISEWNDSTLVVQKMPGGNIQFEEPFKYERRYIMDGSIVDRYKNWNTAVSECMKRFDNGKKYILFGAGMIGKQILNIIGEQKVYCFVDNSFEKQTHEMCGKEIISYDDFKQISASYNCIVTVSYSASIEIGQQLQNDNIIFATLFP